MSEPYAVGFFAWPDEDGRSHTLYNMSDGSQEHVITDPEPTDDLPSNGHDVGSWREIGYIDET